MTLNPELTLRRECITETLKTYLSADNFSLALSTYDDGFATASTFSPTEFIQCMKRFLPERSLTEEAFVSLLDGLCKLQDLPGTEALRSNGTPGNAHAERPTETIDLHEDDGSLAAATPPPHPHRPHSPRDPRKPTLLVGTYVREGETTPNPMVVEDLSKTGVGMLLFTPDGLQPGELLQLQFELDDGNERLIQISVQVRWMRGNIFGAAFVSLDAIPQLLLDYIQS